LELQFLPFRKVQTGSVVEYFVIASEDLEYEILKVSVDRGRKARLL
jgi:hypothetical protein